METQTLSEPLPILEQAAKPRRSLAFGKRVVGGMAAGLALALAFPPHALPWLLPVGLMALFFLLDSMTPRQAAYIGLACGVTLFAVSLRWLWGMFGPAAVSLWVLAGAFPALSCALLIGLRARLPRLPFPLLAAVVWTGIEYFRSEPMVPNFAWMGVGYAFVDFPVAGHVAVCIGSYGLTFLTIFLCASLLTPGRPFTAGRLLSLVALLMLLLPFPTAPLVPAPNASLHVRLVQAASEDDDDLFRLSTITPPAGTQLIVWPEYSYVSDPRRNRKLWHQLQDVARTQNCWFVFGAKDQFDPQDDSHFRNTAFLLNPTGSIVGQHVKNHTVHFIKDGVAGTQAQAFPTPIGVLGIAICFDMDYPDVARRLANNGAEVLIVPSDNPLEWGPVQHAQHRQIFQMRAVECGRWLATTDVAGSTFVVAPNGNIVQSVRDTEPASLTAVVGLSRERTLFLRGGWRFGQISLAALLLLLVWAALPKHFRRTGKLSPLGNPQ